MAGSKVAPFGSWRSPITAELLAYRTRAGMRPDVGLGQFTLDGDDLYWAEVRRAEAGRSVIVRQTSDGRRVDVTPPGFDARSKVHEYGGGAFTVSGGTVYFSNFTDQRIYRQDPGSKPRPITPQGQLRYADARVDHPRGRLICVQEDHSVADSEPVNRLVAVDLEGVAPPQSLASGNDFYAAPRLSRDGSHLTWLAWDHPNMPWDGTELWLAAVGADGWLADPHRLAGGPEESIVQPEWSPDGILHFISDRSGWWNLYRWRAGGAERLMDLDAEFAAPPWIFGRSTYGFVTARRIVCAYSQGGTGTLANLNPANGRLRPIPTPYTEFWGLCVDPKRVVFGAGSATEPPSVVRLDPDRGNLEVLHRSGDVAIPSRYFSLPEPVEFPTEDGRTAHALRYPPKNDDHAGPSEERPPLIVISHGGPTSCTWTTHRLDIQYWTSRGFAVLDVNYGGSTGYGRDYRERLHGQWGVVDLDDCVNGARHLAAREEVDESRMAIRGGSAGGYTTLCALAFRDVFAAGASYYGLSDLEALANETHKFESRYLDRLVGPYPEQRDLYRQRSPLHFTDRISRPAIFFQGLDDKIVPPNQAERMVEALRRRGLPVAYIAFEGEGHGFRRAENLQRAREAELYFYSKVFGFELAEPVEPVAIENL